MSQNFKSFPKSIKTLLIVFLSLFSAENTIAQLDYKLWLQYPKIENSKTIQEYQSNTKGIYAFGTTETIQVAVKELQLAYNGMLGQEISKLSKSNEANTLLLGNTSNLNQELQKNCAKELESISNEGFIIKTITLNNKKQLLITGKTDIGVLYGVFHFIRLLQTNQSINNLSIVDSPKINVRILNHWDNLDATVERGYAGSSIWNWQKLPEFIDQKYIDYARANASVGINGAVLNNVNANALILTPLYLEKVEAL
ncbi:MAG: alpha-glucuronidase family glycosyl hydrolase, partial [Flavobacterium sp.]